jgi:hypothetical protein
MDLQPASQTALGKSDAEANAELKIPASLSSLLGKRCVYAASPGMVHVLFVCCMFLLNVGPFGCNNKKYLLRIPADLEHMLRYLQWGISFLCFTISATDAGEPACVFLLMCASILFTYFP